MSSFLVEGVTVTDFTANPGVGEKVEGAGFQGTPWPALDEVSALVLPSVLWGAPASERSAVCISNFRGPAQP